MIQLEELLPLEMVDDYMCLPQAVQAEAASHYQLIADRRPDITDCEIAAIAFEFATKDMWFPSGDGRQLFRREES